MRMRVTASIGCLLAMVAASIPGLAQAPKEAPRQRQSQSEFFFDVGPLGPPMAFMQGGDSFVFVSSEMSFDGKVVKGAPYSALAVNESIQTLADGNRIVRKTTATVYRDSEGRTRREQTIGKIGPYASAGDPIQTIFINDPVAGVNFILDPNSRTARKIPAAKWIDAGSQDKLVRARESGPPAPDDGVTREIKMRAAARAAEGIGISVNQGGSLLKPKGIKESLGKQMIEGVEAEGTRTTVTIAAGEIGNELPINMVSEQWYSPELQVIVMSRHSDPRSGETTYRLTNINRSEPVHSVFEVPADYTIKEAPNSDMKFRIERDLQKTKKDDQQK